MKDPKEKAAELVEKFKLHAYTNMFSFRIESNLANAKKCALIAVNENINSTFSKNWYNKKRIIPADYLTTDYWIEVKNELLKLQKS
jgi:hypothetical protein